MSVVDEINKDLEKLGGDTSGQTIEEAMDKFGDEIVEKIGEATELPEVSSDDNGSILKVVDGAWAKGEEIKELPEVTSEDEYDILTVNSEGEWEKAANPVQYFWVTYHENIPGDTLEKINELWSGGAVVDTFHFSTSIDGVDGVYYNLPYEFTLDEDEENIEQLDVYITTSTGVVKRTYTSEGITTTTLKELPEVTAADEGDVLTVNSSGEWVAETPASDYPKHTSGLITPGTSQDITLSISANNPENILLVTSIYGSSDVQMHLISHHNSNVTLLEICKTDTTNITVTKTNGYPPKITISNGNESPITYTFITL